MHVETTATVLFKGGTTAVCENMVICVAKLGIGAVFSLLDQNQYPNNCLTIIFAICCVGC